jgi:riboflavin biosynthesis pyrimidine reductase
VINKHTIASAALAPLETLFELRRGQVLPLPAKLARLYGNFRMPLRHPGPQVYSNFVSTMDGVVSLQVKGHSAGGDISGFSIQDRMVMGLLRAVADVVIVGSGTLGADPTQVWTPEAICPELASDYHGLRKALAKREAALNVVVSAGGNIDLRLPVFASGRVPVLIVTTPAGAKRLAKQKPPESVGIRSVRRGSAKIAPSAILDEVARVNPGKRILVEGGPRLLGSFYQERLVGEQFLTLASQIAGREAGDGRLSLVMGKTFAPRDPLWGTLTDVRRGHSGLFLRYSFQ